MDVAVGLNHGSELQAHAKFAKLNGDGGDAAAPGCTTGKGNSPPARKLASLPLTATRLGSARICSRFCVLRASMTAPR